MSIIHASHSRTQETARCVPLRSRLAPTAWPAAVGDPERFDGIRRDYTPADVERLAGRFRIRHTLAEMGAARLWQLLKTEPYRADAGRADRQPGGAAGEGGAAGDLPVRLAGRGRRQYGRRRCIRTSRCIRSNSVPNVVRRINNALRRADQIAQPRGRPTAPTGWRRSSPTPRPGSAAPLNAYRADEGDDRGGRRRRAFRGPARVGEEVRPSRRQGAGADQRSTSAR